MNKTPHCIVTLHEVKGKPISAQTVFGPYDDHAAAVAGVEAHTRRIAEKTGGKVTDTFGSFDVEFPDGSVLWFEVREMATF